MKQHLTEKTVRRLRLEGMSAGVQVVLQHVHGERGAGSGRLRALFYAGAVGDSWRRPAAARGVAKPEQHVRHAAVVRPLLWRAGPRLRRGGSRSHGARSCILHVV